jgi:UDP-N-acetylglucosamine--N-acetylmuramyl-(pentapeptide) pyrophosphoryl-undecaprenol N-acetylglucosamine transferase
MLILDRELTGERLAAALGPLLTDPARREQMARAARVLARPDAGRLVADECARLVAAAGRK